MIIQPAERLGQTKEYYFATKLREIRQRNAEGQDIINLGIGNPDLSPSDHVIKALIQQAAQPGVHGYQPYKGVNQLREAISQWYLSTYGVKRDPETEVLPLMGSKEGIMHISMAFLNPGDQVLVPNPGYLTYRSVAQLLQAEAITYELDAKNQWYPDLEALSQLDLSRVKMMWVNYPHMPTGAPPNRALFQRLIDFAKTHRILLCHDNPYSLILNPNPMSLLSIPDADEVVIEMNSLSKSHNMAGWRVGMLTAKSTYVKAVLTVKSNMDSGMFLPMQQAAIAALQTDYQWHQEQNEIYLKRRELVYELLDYVGCSFEKGQAGMFVWAQIPTAHASGQAVSDHILDQSRVFIAPGFIFGSQGDRYVRVSLCAPEAQIETALHRIKTEAVPQITQ